MITAASYDDLPLVHDLAMKFVNSTGYGKFTTEDQMWEVVKDVWANPNSIIYLNDNLGMIAGIKTPFLFNKNKWQAVELAWWVKPSSRGRKAGRELLKAFEDWAKATGCSMITMISIDENLGKYYEKKGYRLYERAYMKEI